MLTSTQIREQFIDFFVKKCAHTAVPSSPVVPHADPTLLFTNAGMNQFKDVFLGLGDRPYKRAADTQKCIRAGGKHNDLDDVGKDTYHHTFFEMLGNWSFGDYFKTEAIDWAWELLVKQWGMDPTRMHATYFEGNPAGGLAPDEEARELWSKYLPADHIHRGNMKDNFWEMGDTGPCGPCTEIHVDLTADKSGAALVNKGDPRVIEIWNLVFIQFNRNADRSLAPLPARHVDTGMGFERLCAVLQGKTSNYDTDVWSPLFAAIQRVTGAAPYSGTLHSAVDIAYRVIADHARCLTFAITDGATPSNEGRGYVLRRILRRAVRYGRQNLQMPEPFVHRLVPVIVETMGHVFPELKQDPARVAEVIRGEEESFGQTLERGIQLFDEAAVRAEKAGQKIISADDAFKLYDTFGFPIDLTVLMAEERQMKVDTAGFETLMEEARERSRAGHGHAGGELESLLNLVQKGDVPHTQFVGYEHFVVDDGKTSRVLVKQDGHYVAAPAMEVKQDAALVTDRTPFYAESGGQVGDAGVIHSRHGAVFKVNDTIKVGDVVFHLGELESGNIRKGEPAFSGADQLLLEVDLPRRRRIMAHHTVTHVMNWALREVLGEHIMQKGSLVDEEKTRFDFSHTKAMTPDEVARVQQLVNERIDEDLAVSIDYAPQADALKINGLRAVFGEKYPPTVRVVSIGAEVGELLAHPDRKEWRRYSIEFCGGTHLTSTGQAQNFVIVSEEAVAKGVRRITAVAGDKAEKAGELAALLSDQLGALSNVTNVESIESDIAALTERVTQSVIPLTDRQQLRDGVADLQSKVKELKKQQSRANEGAVVDAARQIAESAGDTLLIAEVPGATPDTLGSAMDVIRKKRPDAALLLAAVADGKIGFIASVPEELIKKGLKAGDWVREVAKAAGGNGGGKPDLARAGGKDPAKLADALTAARTFAASKLGITV